MLTSPCSCDDPERFDLLIEPLTATILRIDGGNAEEVALYCGAYTVRLRATVDEKLQGTLEKRLRCSPIRSSATTRPTRAS